MKKWLYILTVMYVTSWSAFANEKGNGGLSFVCRDTAGRITEATIVDLEEATGSDLRSMLDLKISHDDALNLVLANIDQMAIPNPNDTKKLIRDGVTKVESIMVDLPAGNFGLPDPKDYHLRITKPKCGLEVIGLYDDDLKIIKRNKDVYAALSGRDQLAFATHEFFYSKSREMLKKYQNAVPDTLSWSFNDNGKFGASPRAYLNESYSYFDFSDLTRELNGVLFSKVGEPVDSRLVKEVPRIEFMHKLALLTKALECKYQPTKNWKYNYSVNSVINPFDPIPFLKSAGIYHENGGIADPMELQKIKFVGYAQGVVTAEINYHKGYWYRKGSDLPVQLNFSPDVQIQYGLQSASDQIQTEHINIEDFYSKTKLSFIDFTRKQIREIECDILTTEL